MSYPKYCAPLIIMSLSFAVASADPAASDPVPTPLAPPLTPGACYDTEGKKLADVNCGEYEDVLQQQARIADLQQKIAASRGRMDEAGKPAPALSTPAAAPAPEPDNPEVLEVFGENARLRWHGETVTVRVGQRLPHSSWTLNQVSTEGAVLADRARRAFVPVITK
jgi:type IV pilus biogenesis protein PilP